MHSCMSGMASIATLERAPRAARKSTDTYLPAVDGLRALAVTAVVIAHLDAALIGQWTSLGAISVSVFFSISGFLAYYVLWHDEKRLGRISYNYFMARRVLRIWPAYFVT